MHTVLNPILLESNNWQEATLEKIKKDVGLTDQDLSLSQSSSQKNILLFGKPQVGKTSLILALLGISLECQAEVGRILRAGIPKGNSSTSTAMVYCRSNGDYFGISNLEAQEQTQPENFLNSADFEAKLAQIRANVESGTQAESILSISLPQKYFDSNHETSQLRVIDMPGIGSRNQNEQRYVKRLAVYYDTADVKVIVCRADDIESLGKRLPFLPENDAEDWKFRRTEYMVITTYSYSLENIGRFYFGLAPQSRTSSFSEFVQDQVIHATRNVLGQGNCVTVFPLDVGDSFEQLARSLSSEKDREELRNFQKAVLSDIEHTLEQYHGNSFETTINRMRECLDVEMKVRSAAVEEEKAALVQRIRLLSSRVEKSKSSLHTLGDKCEQHDEDVEEAEALCQAVKKWKDHLNIRSSRYQELIRRLDDYIEECSPWGNFKDEESHFQSKVKAEIMAYSASVKEKCPNSLRDTSQWDAYAFTNELSLYVDAQMADLLSVAFPDTRLFRRRRALCGDVISSTNDVADKCRKRLLEEIAAYQHKSEKDLTEKKLLQNALKRSLKRNAELLDQQNQECAALREQLDACDNRQKEICRENEYHQQTLNAYLQIARPEFDRQYERMWRESQSPETPLVKKLQLIMALGLMEQSAKKIFKG